MGILDNILGSAGKEAAGAQQGNLVGELLGMIGGQQGGIAGLVQQFAKKGLGDVVNSWVGTGANMPVTPDQIKQGLGSDVVSQLANKVGIPQDQLASQLSNLLPNVIDKLTPNGKIEQGDILAKGMEALKGMMK